MTIEKLKKVDESLSENEVGAIITEKDRIDIFYNSSFSTTFKTVAQSYNNVASPASGIFKKLVNRIASTLFSKFPEYSTDNEEIRKLIDDNKEDLETTFKQAVFNYVLYGFSVMEINKDGDLTASTSDKWTIQDGELCEVGVLEDTGLQYLNANRIPVSGEVQTVAHIKGKRFLMNGDGVAIELNDGLDISYCLRDTQPFVNYVYLHFINLEYIYVTMLDTLKALRMNVVTTKNTEKEVRNIFNNDFQIIAFNTTGSNGTNLSAKDIFNWVDNKPVAETLQIQREQITLLNQDIVDILDLQDLFNGNIEDNPMETRLASANRIAVSQINWDNQEAKVNNFVEKNLKKWLAFKLKIDYNDVKVEINAVDLSQDDEALKRQQESITGILGLLEKAQTSSPATSEFMYLLIQDILNKGAFSEKLKVGVNKMIVEQTELRQQQEAQQPAPDPAIIQLEADVKKTEAEIGLLEAKTVEVQQSIQQNPYELQLATEDQAQQTLDSKRKVAEDVAKLGVKI